jgi:hypothetical protein
MVGKPQQGVIDRKGIVLLIVLYIALHISKSC